MRNLRIQPTAIYAILCVVAWIINAISKANSNENFLWLSAIFLAFSAFPAGIIFTPINGLLSGDVMIMLSQTLNTTILILITQKKSQD